MSAYAPAALPCAVLLLTMFFWSLKHAPSRRDFAIDLLIATVGAGMIVLLFFPLPHRPSPEGFDFEALRSHSNLVPFRMIGEGFRISLAEWELGNTVPMRLFLVNHVGNLVLFLPVALLLRLRHPRAATRKLLLVILGLSLSVESLQSLLNMAFHAPYRVGDVDDVILNTLGSLPGLLYRPRSVGTPRTSRTPRTGRTSRATPTPRKATPPRSKPNRPGKRRRAERKGRARS